MSFVIPPLPGETLITATTLAARAGWTRGGIYGAIKDGRINAVWVRGRLMVTEADAERFIRKWHSGSGRGRGVSARWAEYRAWKNSQPVGQGATGPLSEAERRPPEPMEAA